MKSAIRYVRLNLMRASCFQDIFSHRNYSVSNPCFFPKPKSFSFYIQLPETFVLKSPNLEFLEKCGKSIACTNQATWLSCRLFILFTVSSPLFYVITITCFRKDVLKIHALIYTSIQ